MQVKRNSIFIKILVPLLVVILLLAVIFSCTLLAGGIIDMLDNNSVRILKQSVENRKITLENDMIQRWSNLEECVSSVLEEARDYGVTSAGILDVKKRREFFTSVSEHLLFNLRKNSVSGVFLVLSNGVNSDKISGGYDGVYMRDRDINLNPNDYSDILMERGEASIASNFEIRLDSFWEANFEYVPDASNMDFFFRPLEAFNKIGGTNFKNMGYWSKPFALGSNGIDAYKIVTYSVPLISDEGEFLGVVGVEVSVEMLETLLPSRELDESGRAGYMLITYNNKQADMDYFNVRMCSGNALKTMAQEEDKVYIESSPGFEDLFLLQERLLYGDYAYGVIQPLNLYNSNTPFESQQWALAGISSHTVLFGLTDVLIKNLIIALCASIVIGSVVAYLVAVYSAKPLRTLVNRLEKTHDNQIFVHRVAGIKEIDELSLAISSLSERQHQVETDLAEERERYLIALESATDIIFEYDIKNDKLTYYSFEYQSEHVTNFSYENFLKMIAKNKVIENSMLAEVTSFLHGEVNEVTFLCRMFTRKVIPGWFTAKGKQVYGLNGSPLRIIGSIKDVTQEQEAEIIRKEADKKDKATGLLKREVAESLLFGKRGCLILMDLDGFYSLNERFGVLYCDIILEEIGQLLNDSGIAYRVGGDEFAVFLQGADLEYSLFEAENLRQSVNDIYMSESSDTRLECCIGIASTDSYNDYTTVFSNAYLAMRKAKTVAPNTIEVYDESKHGKSELIAPSLDLDEITSIYYDINENIVTLAFNLFEMTHDVTGAVPVLLGKIGRRFTLKRILVLDTDVDFFTSSASYQWCARGVQRSSMELRHHSEQDFKDVVARLGDGCSCLRIDFQTEPTISEVVRVGKDDSALFIPMFDNGIAIGGVCFMGAHGRIFTEEECTALEEIVKIMSAHIGKSKHDLASKAKSEFLSRMSHEIRTPMNAIMGMAHIAINSEGVPVRVEDCLKKIDSSAKYLLSLINDILDMSRIESGKLVLDNLPFSLKTTIADIIVLIQAQSDEKEIKLYISNSVDVDMLYGDALRLSQIIVNLLGNAVKFTPRGGEVDLDISKSGDGQNEVTIKFCVTDTGIGIGIDDQQRIFNAFEQADSYRKYGGTGLGLAISEKLVRMMGGRLEMESDLGKGAKFMFSISFELAESSELVVEKSESNVELAGRRILMVEDNELNVEIGKTILEMVGVEVDIALNGMLGVEAFKASDEGYYDVILMDIRMPVMDGLEATRMIRKLERNDARTIPIVAMTANAFDDDMKKSIESGMNGHLAKPFEVKALYELMGRLIQ